MSYDIQEIKSRMTIPDMLRKLGHECPHRKSPIIKSPLRDERTASFATYDNGQKAKDFGGDFQGDVIDLYQAMHDCDRIEAIKVLAEFAGVAEAAPERLSTPKVSRRQRVQVTEFAKWNDEWLDFASKACDRINVLKSIAINDLMIRKKWSFPIIYKLVDEGALGCDESGKLVYIYPHGIKRRGNHKDSRGDRWIFGGAKDNLWRGGDLSSSTKDTVFLTEGESDLVSLLNYREEGDNEICCSIPGSSWNPDAVMAHYVGSHRRVYLLFDCDTAGFAATKKVHKALMKHAFNCEVYALSWRKVSRELGNLKRPDLSDVIGKLKEKIDKYIISI